MKWFAISLALGSLAYGATTIDEIVGVVGKHAIKMTDIERDLRVTQFLNGEPPSSSVAAMKKALERLIDQELIRNDMAASKNASHLDNEATTLFNQMLSDRFGSSKPQMAAELRRHGLTEAQLLEQLQWQLVVLRFIDQRFRPGVIVNDEDVRAYYDKNSGELERKYPANHSFEALAPKIRETLEADRINQNFEEWISNVRKDTRIEYKLDELK